jgi:phosphoglycolate phosphatase-like HAD superfamily hydrolase
MVGDSRVDVATARDAGVELIAVSWGLGSLEELRGAGARADEIVASVEELRRRLVQ